MRTPKGDLVSLRHQLFLQKLPVNMQSHALTEQHCKLQMAKCAKGIRALDTDVRSSSAAEL